MRAIDADELKTAFPVCDNSKPVLIASVRATINHMPTIEPRCETCEAFNKTRLLIPQPQRKTDMREDAEEPKKCDTCKHEKERWFSRCADCSDFELWESKE